METGHISPINNYDDYGFTPLQIPYESRPASGASPLKIINTAKCGKRIEFDPELIENIGSPTTIQVTVNEKGIAIGGSLPEGGTSFVLRKSGKTPCVYSSNLVVSLTTLFGLNFEDRTSLSFRDVEYLNSEDGPVAFVPLRPSGLEEEEANVSRTTSSSDAQLSEMLNGADEEAREWPESVAE